MGEEGSIGSTNFWHIVRVRFDKTQGLFLTLILGLIGIITAISNSLYIGAALFIGLVLVVFIWTLYRTADDLFDENISLKRDKNSLPSVIQVRREEALALCLLKPSNLFSYNALVTFYDYHENYERPIGFGEVVNIQEDGIIQVELIYILKGHEKLLERLIQNNAECLKRIRVKPVILKRYLTQLREGGT
jgi:hypothetical protein